MPNIELLQWLARGDLKQKLLQAVRLWVWWRVLYGDAKPLVHLPEPFTYADWRNAFFSPTHTKGEEKPTPHDPNCPCAKTTAAWLWGSNWKQTQAQWLATVAEPKAQAWLQEQIEQFEQSLRAHRVLPNPFQSLLHRAPFALTRRALAADLQVLVDLGWLDRYSKRYYRVSPPPTLPTSRSRGESGLMAYNLEFLTQPDLAAIADNLSQRLGGYQRFFVHVEYVISPSQLDRVDEWQERLRELWQQTPIPPVQLTYSNASLLTTLQAVVYPVCIYYYKRGPYLCAFGQIPQGEFNQTDWRNYRLDRIQEIIPLAWDDRRIPPALQKSYQTQTLPNPDFIQEEMESAWGFDYYQPSQLLLLRFDQEWNQRYIRQTLRHATFEAVDYARVGTLIRRETQGEAQQKLLALWRKRSPDDAYYQAHSRQGDPNVMQRLRAWRPRVEILLPWTLRQQAAREVERERSFYLD